MSSMTDAPSLDTESLDAVGTIAVVDLEAACELYGRDMLPYPLGRSRPVGSVWLLTREVGRSKIGSTVVTSPVSERG
ncbi:Uncharacterised protein [Mycolicibacterium fortuitum]|uniref:Uncharacterized protein n=1 Tax=Mycolicibacterium fortuitum TaxID=1766 RepID=A0A378V032_MYCFO|nr:Uncharacterised protein [Mycolicibacterium fortuitum]